MTIASVCPLCGSTVKDLMYSELKIVKCRSCNLVYTSPLPDSEELNKLYDKSYYYDTKKYDPRIWKPQRKNE